MCNIPCQEYNKQILFILIRLENIICIQRKQESMKVKSPKVTGMFCFIVEIQINLV